MYPNYNIYNPFSIREETDSEVISLTQAIQLIRQSLNDEKEDQLFYDSLLRISPNQIQRGIIKTIREDEVRHQRILQTLYDRLINNSGDSSNNSNGNNTVNNANNIPFLYDTNDRQSYKSLLERAMLAEIKAAKKYRRILGAMPDKESYTLMMALLTDEMMHATMFNYLLSNL